MSEKKTEKKKLNYILLIMNCIQYKEKAQRQRDSWLKELPTSIIYYHVIGIPLLDRDFIFSEKEHILYVKTKDDYNSLPQKVISAYDAIYRSFHFQYIFKTDDDQNVLSFHHNGLNNFFDMVIQQIENDKIQYHYGGKIINITRPHYSQYHKIHPELPPNLPILQTKYCNGRFYFLSYDAIQSLIDKKYVFQNEYFEDYAIGFHLNEQFKKHVLFIDSDIFLRDFLF